MRPGVVRRTDRIDDGEPLGIPQRLERRKRWMQTKEAVEIERCFCVTRLWPGNRNRRAQIVIRSLAVWHHHVETIDSAPLKNRDQSLAASTRQSIASLCNERPFEKRWRGK